jgi:CO/xanthine dehydrogenase Mo-binding subunit
MSGAPASNGCYDIPLVDHEVVMLFTHTAPVDAYRGAGRPEMGFLIERLVHKTALELGVDPVDLKRRNFIRPEQMPYTNSATATYESGSFDILLGKAMKAIDWNGFEARKAEARQRGMLLGHSIANYIEVTGSGLLTEEVDVAVKGDGSVRFVCGTQSMGQGLRTSFAQVAADTLQIDPSRIVVFEGDSAIVRSGGGSGGSRSLQVGGNAVLSGAIAVVARGRQLAARALEAAEGDIEYDAGRYRIVGTDRSVSLFELARKSWAQITLTASAAATGRRGRADVRRRKSKSSAHRFGATDAYSRSRHRHRHQSTHRPRADPRRRGGRWPGIDANVVYDSQTGQPWRLFSRLHDARAYDLPSIGTDSATPPTRFNKKRGRGSASRYSWGDSGVVSAVIGALRARCLSPDSTPRAKGVARDQRALTRDAKPDRGRSGRCA